MADNDVPPIHLHVTVNKHDSREIGMHVEHADHVTHQTQSTPPRDAQPSTMTSSPTSPSIRMSQLSLTTSPTNTTELSMTSQLMEIIEYEEIMAKLHNENNFDSAYVKALKISKYDLEIQNISSLLKLYDLTMKVKIYDSVSSIRDKITLIIRNKTQLTASQVKSVSKDLRIQKKYLKSILFHPIAFSLFEDNNDPDNDVKNMGLCVVGIQNSVKEMLKENQNMKSVVQHHVIPLMRELKSKVENLPVVKAELKITKLSSCLCNIGYCENLADIDEFQTYTEGLRLMDTIENKRKYEVYGTLLNNIGVWYDRHSRYSEAVSKYTEAIEAYKQATDWPNDEVKQSGIKTTENNLRSSKEKM